MMYDSNEEVDLIDISMYMDDDDAKDEKEQAPDDKVKSAKKTARHERNNKNHSSSAVWAGRVGIIMGVTILALVVFLYGVMAVLCLGPSKTARTQFVLSVQETSAIGFLANWFCSDEEQNQFARNPIAEVS